MKGRRKLKIQIRLSPTSKPKAKPTKKGPETGVAASDPYHPASTNVSSPIQAASRRRIQRGPKTTLDSDLPKNRSSRDGDFIMGDDEDDAHIETEDDSEESFEPVRIKGKVRSVRKRSLGPPITTDEKIETLNHMHRYVVEDFLNTAKQQSQKVSTH